MPEDNGMLNPSESYTNKYQKHVACSYGYKLVCVDDQFSKPFKSYLGKYSVYDFISSMKVSIVVMWWKRKLTKNLWWENDNKDIENSTKCRICDNDYTDTDVKVRDSCHVTGKYKFSSYRDCNLNVKLNHKISVVFHNLNYYDSHHIMQKLGKFNLKINVIPNGLEKYMSFSINDQLSFINSFQFLSSSLDSLVKNLNEDYFKCLSQEFDNNVLDLVKRKGSYPYEYMSDFEKFKEELSSKEKLYSSLTA